MRIISGKYRGKRITAPKKLPVRPTTDRAKEALFNILNNRYYFDRITVLDLFAGIGSIGFEFASRGTRDITCVDKHYGCINFIEKTNTELKSSIHTAKGNVFTFLEHTNRTYDVIFADPPYDIPEERFLKLVDLVFDNDLLEEDGLLIVEHSKFTDLSAHPHFELSKAYGSSVFSFFHKPAKK